MSCRCRSQHFAFAHQQAVAERRTETSRTQILPKIVIAGDEQLFDEIRMG